MSAANQEQVFAERFAQAWRAPTPEGLLQVLHDKVVLYQPHLPPIRGKTAARTEFTRLLHTLPGLRGEVDRTSGAEGVVFIEWRMILPGAGNAGIGMVDRFFIRDGLALERRVYFDQLALIRAVVTHPRLWAAFLRYRFGH